MDVSVAGGTGVKAGAQPLNRTVSKTNASKTDPIDFSITSSPNGFIVLDTG
jgi:hypothetical protein